MAFVARPTGTPAARTSRTNVSTSWFTEPRSLCHADTAATASGAGSGSRSATAAIHSASVSSPATAQHAVQVDEQGPGRLATHLPDPSPDFRRGHAQLWSSGSRLSRWLITWVTPARIVTP